MMVIKATIFFEKRFWIGTFERADKEGYAVARHVFGGEPSDLEVYEFVLNHYQELQFGDPKEFTLEIKRMNPKRVQKEVRREMERLKETTKPSTHAQNYMREELEKKKRQTVAEKEVRKRQQFALKQTKRTLNFYTIHDSKISLMARSKGQFLSHVGITWPKFYGRER